MRCCLVDVVIVRFLIKSQTSIMEKYKLIPSENALPDTPSQPPRNDAAPAQISKNNPISDNQPKQFEDSCKSPNSRGDQLKRVPTSEPGMPHGPFEGGAEFWIPRFADFLEKVEFDNSFDAPVLDIKELIVPEDVWHTQNRLLKKREFDIAFNRDFFYNRDRNIFLRNRYKRIYEQSIFQNTPFVYKRVKGKSLNGESN